MSTAYRLCSSAGTLSNSSLHRGELRIFSRSRSDMLSASALRCWTSLGARMHSPLFVGGISVTGRLEKSVECETSWPASGNNNEDNPPLRVRHVQDRHRRRISNQRAKPIGLPRSLHTGKINSQLRPRCRHYDPPAEIDEKENCTNTCG